MNTNELLPCPFCGELQIAPDGFIAVVHKPSCFLRHRLGTVFLDEQFEESWNTRTPQPKGKFLTVEELKNFPCSCIAGVEMHIIPEFGSIPKPNKCPRCALIASIESQTTQTKG